MKDESPFLLAGIWDEWTNKNTGEVIPSFSLITTHANKIVSEIHDRMPVIINEKEASAWLDTEHHKEDYFLSMLGAFDSRKMKSYPVSTELNNARNNYPELLTPVEPQKSLF